MGVHGSRKQQQQQQRKKKKQQKRQVRSVGFHRLLEYFLGCFKMTFGQKIKLWY